MSARRAFAQSDLLSEVLSSLRIRSTLFGLGEACAPWGFSMPRQDLPVFHLSVDAHGVLHVGGGPEPVPFGPGDLVVLPTGRSHSLRDEPGSPVRPFPSIVAENPPDERGCIRFGGEGPEARLLCGEFFLLKDVQGPVFSRLPAHLTVRTETLAPGDAVRETIRRIRMEAGDWKPGRRAVIDRLLDLLLTQVVRDYMVEADGPGASIALSEPTIGRALRLMHEDPGAPWTVAELARSVAMSRSAFAAQFADVVGTSPIRYLTLYRLSYAAELLTEGDAGLRKVARAVGYGSVSAFSRAFKRRYRVSPGHYRNGSGPQA